MKVNKWMNKYESILAQVSKFLIANGRAADKLK